MKDKVIFLTGGSTGIGLDCAKAYAAEGARIVLSARDGKTADTVASELPGQHYGIRCDVSVGSEMEHAIQFTQKKFGRLDAIYNNAGIAHPSKPLHETTEAEWDALMSINLKSVFWTTKFGYEALKQAGAAPSTQAVWGGDWPACTLMAPLKKWLHLTQALVAHAPSEQRAKFFAQNAVRFYRLEQNL